MIRVILLVLMMTACGSGSSGSDPEATTPVAPVPTTPEVEKVPEVKNEPVEPSVEDTDEDEEIVEEAEEIVDEPVAEDSLSEEELAALAANEALFDQARQVLLTIECGAEWEDLPLETREFIEDNFEYSNSGSPIRIYRIYRHDRYYQPHSIFFSSYGSSLTVIDMSIDGISLRKGGELCNTDSW